MSKLSGTTVSAPVDKLNKGAELFKLLSQPFTLKYLRKVLTGKRKQLKYFVSRFYSDEEAFCQMYHMCVAEATGTFKKFSFLCPNGTVFNQEKLVCDAWFNVDCSENTISNDASTLDLLDAERTFITLGLESDEPEIDFPWRYRNGV